MSLKVPCFLVGQEIRISAATVKHRHNGISRGQWKANPRQVIDKICYTYNQPLDDSIVLLKVQSAREKDCIGQFWILICYPYYNMSHIYVVSIWYFLLFMMCWQIHWKRLMCDARGGVNKPRDWLRNSSEESVEREEAFTVRWWKQQRSGAPRPSAARRCELAFPAEQEVSAKHMKSTCVCLTPTTFNAFIPPLARSERASSSYRGDCCSNWFVFHIIHYNIHVVILFTLVPCCC